MNKDLGRLGFCKEKQVFGLVIKQNSKNIVEKLWTPIGIVDTLKLSVVVIKSIWDLIKLVRDIWKWYKSQKVNEQFLLDINNFDEQHSI